VNKLAALFIRYVVYDCVQLMRTYTGKNLLPSDVTKLPVQSQQIYCWCSLQWNTGCSFCWQYGRRNKG